MKIITIKPPIFCIRVVGRVFQGLWLNELDEIEFERFKDTNTGWSEDGLPAQMLLGTKDYRFYPSNTVAKAIRFS